ncbi:MAG: branched-chain amino acid ABC transporter permease [Rhodoplanes sp.]|uniref:branched-chain amino acid ABC transporter permease n=1 Tax=Rhodoplanes sp. TaxID=1968906 RepID=UPI00181517D2|nr:branched-chain amino acid ABC transporter permease [Rhodoplanes sp.]NVO15496.1 branched-chain amino acid ABC transporter permease [Rhodoplanes sp.]
MSQKSLLSASLLAAARDRLDISIPVLLVLAVLFVLLPLIPGEFILVVGTEILILGLFALSFNLIHGFMGQISFGHAAFFGLGAYTTALILQPLTAAGGLGTITFLLAILAAVPVSALGALVVGYFCVRLTGIYFAMLSMAFGELIFYVVFSWYSFTKGDDGIQGLMPPPLLKSPVVYYYFTFVVVALAAALLWRITRSPFGYTLRLLRDNPARTAFLGIDVRRVMLVNFVLAGSFAGLAGALWGPFARSVSPTLLGWAQSGVPVFMSLIGGAGYFAGPLVGSIVYTGLNSYVTRFTIYWPLTIGLVILAMVLFLPGGLLSVVDGWLKAKRRGEP